MYIYFPFHPPFVKEGFTKIAPIPFILQKIFSTRW